MTVSLLLLFCDSRINDDNILNIWKNVIQELTDDNILNICYAVI